MLVHRALLGAILTALAAGAPTRSESSNRRGRKATGLRPPPIIGLAAQNGISRDEITLKSTFGLLVGTAARPLLTQKGRRTRKW